MGTAQAETRLANGKLARFNTFDTAFWIRGGDSWPQRAIDSSLFAAPRLQWRNMHGGQPMNRFVLAAAALSLLAASANAATITYDIGTTTATFAGGGLDTLTGTFTVDFTANTLTNIAITVSGNVIPGVSPPVPTTFGTPNTLSPNTVGAQNPAGQFVVVHLVFQDNLGNSPDAITQVNFTQGSIGLNVMSLTASGTATPQTSATPLPAALPLFATGIGGLGFLGWRRKRKAQAVA
jgi:hypothetical protein